MILNKMQTTYQRICKFTFISIFAFTTVALANTEIELNQNKLPPDPLASYIEPIKKEILVSHIEPFEQILASYIEPIEKPIGTHANSAALLQGHNLKSSNSQNVITPEPHNVITPNTNQVINDTQPNETNVHVNPLPVITNAQPSHLNSTNSQKNIINAKTWNQQFINKADNAQLLQQVNSSQHQYRKDFYNNNMQRFNVYGHYWKNDYYHNWYKRWYKWGFYGGYWYPLRPCFDIEEYFTYPAVQWFFKDEPDTAHYYNTYYSSEQEPPAICLEDFPYKHIYFPTDTLRDLLIEVSGFTSIARCNFRTGIIYGTARLKDIASNYVKINFSYQQNDVVINYYQNLQNQAIVIAGFVNQGKINIAFEMFLDLLDPKKNIIFAPDGQTPTDAQLQALYQLNNRIQKLGGDPFTAKQEPQPNKNNIEEGSPIPEIDP